MELIERNGGDFSDASVKQLFLRLRPTTCTDWSVGAWGCCANGFAMSSSIFVHSHDRTVLHAQCAEVSAGRPACVFVHGYADGAYVWNGVRAVLRGICSTVAIDLRGHGESEYSRSGRYDMRVHTADVARIVKSLALGRVILVGHSLGGRIVTRLAAQLRDCTVIGLVLADSCPEPNAAGMCAVVAQLRQSLRTYESMDAYMRWLMTNRPLLSETMAQQIALEALRPCEGGLEPKVDRALAQLNFDDVDGTYLWSLLAGIKCPTMVVRGMGSAVVSAAVAARMVSLLPDGRLVTLAKAGHAVMSDNPEAFGAILRQFVVDIQAREDFENSRSSPTVGGLA